MRKTAGSGQTVGSPGWELRRRGRNIPDSGRTVPTPGRVFIDNLEGTAASESKDSAVPEGARRAATIGPARLLGLENKLGTIEPGKTADLVLLDADPLADIRNTRRISGVVVNGRWLGPDDLKKILDQAAADASR